MTEPTSYAGAPAPLTPPEGNPLTLSAPAPPPVVAATQAPAMAPQVDPASLPLLDGKVDGFVNALMTAQTRSPEFTKQAANVRSMGDADIRRAAETSNRLLQTPVRALKEGGIAEGSKVGNTLMELRRTVEDLDPSQATGARKFLGMIPFGDKVVDYFRRYESAQSPPERHPARPAQRPGRADQGQRRAQHGEAEPLGDHGPAQPVRLHRRAPRCEAGRDDQPATRSPIRRGPRRSARTCCSTSGRSTRTC